MTTIIFLRFILAPIMHGKRADFSRNTPIKVAVMETTNDIHPDWFFYYRKYAVRPFNWGILGCEFFNSSLCTYKTDRLAMRNKDI